MKYVDVDMKTFKTLPGYTTKLTVSRWKGQIDSLLYELQELGLLKRKMWMMDEDKSELLYVEMEVNVNGVVRRVQFKLEPVIIRVKKRIRGGRTPWTLEAQPQVSWKIFHDLLERKIAAIRLGMAQPHHEFMQYITKQLPDGREVTFGDFMDQVIELGRLDQLQLTDQRERGIEVEP
jgi:hypothetical protein